MLVAADSVDTEVLRQLHADDTFVPLDPGTLTARLEAIGFREVAIERGDYELRFHATKPAATPSEIGTVAPG